jgi:hypothetical protein
MAKPRMDLSAFVGKLLEEQDGDELREGIRVLSQALMEAEVAASIGAEHHERTGERTAYRNGSRTRTCGQAGRDNRVGDSQGHPRELLPLAAPTAPALPSRSRQSARTTVWSKPNAGIVAAAIYEASSDGAAPLPHTYVRQAIGKQGAATRPWAAWR